MGQYYKPINLDDKQWLYSHDFGDGLKLMEHSWIGNDFVGAVMALMAKGGDWYKKRIVWAGDYFGDEGEEPYYANAEDYLKLAPATIMTKDKQRTAKLVNHTKKLYVRYDEIPGGDGDWKDWFINPLPLLTACGNGRGGGDYRSPAYSWAVGQWAGDVLSIEFAVPKSQWYKKLIVGFQEED